MKINMAMRRISKRTFLVLTVGLFVGIGVAGALPPRTSHAATGPAVKGRWINVGAFAVTIAPGQERVFYDTNPSDNNREFISPDSPLCQKDTKFKESLGSSGPNSTDLIFHELTQPKNSAGATDCVIVDHNILTSNTQNVNKYFWAEGNTIHAWFDSDGSAMSFTLTDSTKKIYTRSDQTGQNCPDIIQNRSGQYVYFAMANKDSGPDPSQYSALADRGAISETYQAAVGGSVATTCVVRSMNIKDAGISDFTRAEKRKVNGNTDNQTKDLTKAACVETLRPSQDPGGIDALNTLNGYNMGSAYNDLDAFIGAMQTMQSDGFLPGRNSADTPGEHGWSALKDAATCILDSYQVSDVANRTVTIPARYGGGNRLYSMIGFQPYNSDDGLSITNGIADASGKPPINISPTSGQGTAPGAQTTTTSTSPTCEKNDDPLTYFLCPVFNGVAHFADFLFNGIIQPFLITQPISTSPSDPIFQVWSTFRLYGDLLVLILVLVAFIAQALFGGVNEALAVRKTLPAALLVLIVLNVSIYGVSALVDIVNVIGNGIGDVMTAPLRAGNGTWSFQLNGAQAGGAFAVGIIGLIAAGGSIIGALSALFFAQAAFAKAAIWAALFVLIPVVLAIVTLFATLVIRKGIILILVLISPVAIALYVLPNTRRAAEKWWDWLTDWLAVYPLVMIVVAASDILSVTILRANNVLPANFSGGGTALTISQIIAAVIAFFLQFLVLFLIIFIVREMGKGAGRLVGAIEGGTKKINERVKKRGEASRQRYYGQTLQGRERTYRAMGEFGDRHSWAKPLTGGARFLAGGTDMLGESAAYRAQQLKAAQETNDAGDDSERRALTVNKTWALRHGTEGQDWRSTSDGRRQFRTLGGVWVDENQVDAAHSRWGGNQAALQWSLGHEMEKATTQEEQDRIRTHFASLVRGQGGWGMGDGEIQAVWKGAAFGKQNVAREWKHYSWEGENRDLGFSAVSMMREIDEKQGNYQMMMQSADTWTTMSQAMVQAQHTVDDFNSRVANDPASIDDAARRAHQEAQEVLTRGSRIAFAARSGAMIPQGDEGAAPIPVGVGTPATPTTASAPGTTSTTSRPVGAGAAGKVQEEMNRFVQTSDLVAGVYRPPSLEAEGVASVAQQRPPELTETLESRVRVGRRTS